MTSRWKKQSPKRRSVEKIRASREAVSQSPIVENDWADTYVNTRDADLYRFANDLELLKEKVETGTSVCEHGAAPFVLSHALSSEGYDLYAGDASPE